MYHGITAYFSIANPGSQAGANSENHVACLGEGNGIVNKYRNARFTEHLILYDTNSYWTDDEGGDRLYAPNELRDPVKREIVYVYLDG